MSSSVYKLLAATLLTGFAVSAHAQLTPNQTIIANAIAAPAGTPSTALLGVQNSLAGLAPADLPNAYSQLSPGSYAVLPDITLRTAEFEESTVRRYLRDFRAGGTGVPGKAGEAAPGARKFGSFLIASGQTGKYDGNADHGRIGYGSQGVIGGLDLRFGEKSLIGVMGGYQNADVRLDQYSRNSRIGSYFGGGYGTLGVGPLYVDVFGTYGEAKYDLRRAVNFGANTIAPTALSFDSRTRSRTWLGGATTGLSFNYLGFEFEPFVGARYANLRVDAYADGTDVGSLAFGRSTYESVLGTAGLRIGGAVDLGNGVSMRPEIRGAYRHEFDRYGSRGIIAGFGGPGVSTIAFQPAGLQRDYGTAGAGFTISSANSPFSVVVDYDGEFAKDREIHGVTGGFRLTF